jgi:hypothetical protein
VLLSVKKPVLVKEDTKNMALGIVIAAVWLKNQQQTTKFYSSLFQQWPNTEHLQILKDTNNLILQLLH